MEVLLLALWAAFVSYVEERYGKFVELPPNVKQWVNASLAVILPAIVIWITNHPWWQADFGNPETLLTELAWLFVPVVLFLVNQIAHQFDRLLQKYGG